MTLYEIISLIAAFIAILVSIWANCKANKAISIVNNIDVIDNSREEKIVNQKNRHGDNNASL
ncbi:MAG: hypothetical protein ACRCVW_01170 [Brevinema sp.]